MRKQYKKKKHSCVICKPQKMKGSNRWSQKEIARAKEDNEQIRNNLN